MKYNYLVNDSHGDTVEAGSLIEAAFKAALFSDLELHADKREDIKVLLREDTLTVVDKEDNDILHVAPAV